MMGTWTNMKVNKMVEFSVNATRTHVTIRTIENSYTASVVELREKLKSNHLLKPVRQMFQSMVDYAEKRDA